MVPVVSSVLLVSLLKNFIVNLILGPGLVGSLLATTGLFVFSFSLFLSITASN